MRIRSDILRTYQALHTWTGITAGLLLFVGFFAGALTMFQGQLTRWATPPSHQLPQVEPTQYDALVQQVLAHSPKASKELTVHFSGDHSPVTWFEQGASRGVRLDDQVWHGTMNSSGELETQLASPNKLGDLLDYLHRTAGIIGEIDHDHAGVYILGIAAILYFLALVSGVIFLLPTLVKSFFALRSHKGPNRFWLDSHNLIGIASLPFHLVIALTAVVFAFHDFYYGGLQPFYGDKPLFERGAPDPVPHLATTLPPLQQHVAQATAYAPGYSVDNIRFAGLGGPRPMATLAMVNEQATMRGPVTDFIFMHPFTLEIVNSSYPQGDEGVWGRAVSTFFALHFGSYGGDDMRWIYFAMGLGGAFLFYSGNLIWLEKRRQKKGGPQTRASRIMAALTVGVSLGCILGIAVTLLSTKWLTGRVTNINSTYLAMYYGAFAATLAYAFARGAARAAIHAQMAIAVLCLLIPVTSLLGWLLPGLGLWTPRELGLWMVDGVALVFALAFWLAARKTRQRAMTGERQSIWALEAGDDKTGTADMAPSRS